MNRTRAAAGVLAAALLPLTLTASPAAAGEADSPAFRVTDVVSNGSGCGKDSRAGVVAEYGTLRVDHGTDMTAVAGTRPDGAYVAKANRNCTVMVTLEYPDGWTFAVTGLVARGYADLADGARGRYVASTHFAGGSQTGGTSRDLAADRSGEWVHYGEVEAAPFAPCGQRRPLALNSRVQSEVGEAGRASYNVVDNSGVDAVRAFLTWKRC